MDELLDMYEDILMHSLRFKAEVVELLKGLKSLGKNIAVVTEGPQDAQ